MSPSYLLVSFGLTGLALISWFIPISWFCLTSSSLAGDPPIRAVITPSAISPDGESTTTVSLDHQGSGGIAGFLLQLCHDPAVVNPVEVELSPEIETINDGNQPAFSQLFIAPEGVYVAAVFTIQGPPTLLPPGSVTPLATLIYTAVGVEGESSGLVDCPLTSPPSENYVVIDTAPIPISLEGELTVGTRFRRGDVNDDGFFDLADPIALGAYLFAGGDDSLCPRAGDANLDGVRDLGDMVTLLQVLFGAGSPDAFGDCILEAGNLLPCEPTGSCPN